MSVKRDNSKVAREEKQSQREKGAQLPVLRDDELIEPIDDTESVDFGSVRSDAEPTTQRQQPKVPRLKVPTLERRLPRPGIGDGLDGVPEDSLETTGALRASIGEAVDQAFASIKASPVESAVGREEALRGGQRNDPSAPATAQGQGEDTASEPIRKVRSATEVVRSRGGFAETSGRRKRITGALSGPMRLLLHGLEGEQPGKHGESPSRLSDFHHVDGLPSRLTQAQQAIRPTALGWVVIGAIFLASMAFVIYKKTDLFGERSNLVDDTLSLDDIKPLEEEVEQRVGTIQLDSSPAGATFLMHVGDTPAKIDTVDIGGTYIIRVEREGYRTRYRVVGPGDFSDGIARVQVMLEPMSGGGVLLPPEYPRTGTAESFGTIEVTSVPPSSSVWLVMGKGRLRLPERIAASHNFMALLPGFQPSFVNVSPSEFKGDGTIIDKRVNLTRADVAGSSIENAKSGRKRTRKRTSKRRRSR